MSLCNAGLAAILKNTATEEADATTKKAGLRREAGFFLDFFVYSSRSAHASAHNISCRAILGLFSQLDCCVIFLCSYSILEKHQF